MAPPSASAGGPGRGGLDDDGALRAPSPDDHEHAPAGTNSAKRPSLASLRLSLRRAAACVTPGECSGALGDLGTFLPLTLGLVTAVGLDLGTTLLFTGVYNVYSGYFARVPMCVQPMKTIAAVAIAAGGSVTLPQVMAAGVFVSAAVLLLGVTRLVDALNALVPRSVVRGLQLGVGLKLAGSGLRMALTLKAPKAGAAAAAGAGAAAGAAVKAAAAAAPGGPSASAAASSAVAALKWRPALGSDGLLLGVLALAFLLVTTVARRSEEEPRDVDPLPPLRLLPVSSWRARRRRRRAAGGEAASASSVDGASSSTLGDKTEHQHQQQPQQHQQQQQQHHQQQQHQHQHQHQQHQAVVSKGPKHADDAEAPPPPSPQPLSAPPPCIAADACCPLTPAPPPASSARRRRFRVPSALIVVLVGVALTVATAPSGALSGLKLGPSKPQVIVPSPADFLAGITTAGGLAQLPLTTLNSVIAVTQLADALYGGARPSERWRWRPSLVAASVGLMNLVGCFFGAMPACHGSGGLAAQHLYGARTGAAPMMLGALKIFLALLFGSSLFELLRRFPEPLLGAMLTLSGVELACAARREGGPRGFCFAALTAAAILALDDAALGFAVGYGGWLAVISHEAACGWAGRGLQGLKKRWAARRAARGASAASPLVVAGEA